MRANPKMDAHFGGFTSHRGLLVTLTVIGFVVLASWALQPADTAAKVKPKDAPERVRPPLEDRLPPMHFLSGILTQDSKGTWKINEVPIWFTKDSQLTAEENPAENIPPQEGRMAILMGHWQGKSFVVRQGTIKNDSNLTDLLTPSGTLVRSINPKADPTRVSH